MMAFRMILKAIFAEMLMVMVERLNIICINVVAVDSR
jgi:hypothetical protein